MAGVSCQSSVVETPVGLDIRNEENEKAPRKIAGPVSCRVPRARAHEKAPAVLVAVGAGACGFLDDLHVGADAFRGDIDVAGP